VDTRLLTAIWVLALLAIGAYYVTSTERSYAQCLAGIDVRVLNACEKLRPGWR